MRKQVRNETGPGRRDAREHRAVTALALEGVARRYGRGAGAVHALRGVDVELPHGSFTAVMGPSGSGKSTLLQCAAGLDRPTSGSVRLGGQELTRMGVRGLTRLRRERVGFVFQSFNLVPTLTAEQNVLLPLRLAGGSRRGPARERALRALARVGLADRAASRPGELSGGQQQRVALARALVTGPEVICGDEPTGALDPVTAGEVLTLLRDSVTDLGATVLMVTHDPVAAARADRVLFLADGLLVDELRVDHRNGGTRAREGTGGPGARGDAGTTSGTRNAAVATDAAAADATATASPRSPRSTGRNTAAAERSPAEADRNPGAANPDTTGATDRNPGAANPDTTGATDRNTGAADAADRDAVERIADRMRSLSGVSV